MEHRIAVRVPTMGWVKTELMARLLEYWRDPRIDASAIANVQDVAAARNELVLYHYDYVAYTHLLMIDADTVPPKDFIDRMLAVNRPVVSGVTHIFKPYRPNVGGPELRWALWQKELQKDGTPTWNNVRLIPSEGLLERRGLATGAFCLLIRSEVLEKLSSKLPWFKTEYEEMTQEKRMSEDLYFCERVEEAGWTLTILCDLVCSHWKTTDLSQVSRLVEVNVERTRAGMATKADLAPMVIMGD